MPGWTLQISWNKPTFGKVYVTFAGGAFGPAGESTPLEAGDADRDRLPAGRRERGRVVDELGEAVEVERAPAASLSPV